MRRHHHSPWQLLMTLIEKSIQIQLKVKVSKRKSRRIAQSTLRKYESIFRGTKVFVGIFPRCNAICCYPSREKHVGVFAFHRNGNERLKQIPSLMFRGS